MSALEGLGAAVVLLVVAGATWMTYVALGHMLRDFRRQCQKLPAERKRTVGISMTVTALLCMASVTLVIVQPWGARTFLYLFGSLSVAAVVSGLIGAAGAASRDVRRARRRSNAKN